MALRMLTVISHDAGGAEILSSLVRRRALACAFVLDGPALRVFERKLGAVRTMPLVEAMEQASEILCGTSWQSDLEFRAIGMARRCGIRSVAFLDHWVNYTERFSRDGVTHLPDALWVGDAYAHELARRLFPDREVVELHNPYLEDILEQMAAMPQRAPSAVGLSVLYVCEPVAEHARLRHADANFWGYTEFSALRYFLANIAVLGTSVERVILRPHPSEHPDKYLGVAAEFDLPIETGGGKSLLEEVWTSDVVAGCESMALVVALAAGKRVISCIPEGARDCSLPHAGIERLASLLKA